MPVLKVSNLTKTFTSGLWPFKTPQSYTAVLLSALFVTTTLLGEGFVAGTLICTPQGHLPIEELSVGDRVVTCDFDKGYKVESIVEIESQEITDFIRIKIGDINIDVDPDHKFFVPFTQEWIQASDLVVGTCMLGAPLHAVYVESVESIEQKAYVYNLSLAKHHNYLVSERSIMVHNIAPAGCAIICAAKGTTVINAFLLANPITAPVVIGTGGAVLVGYVTWTFARAIKESRNTFKNDQSKSDIHRGPSKQKRKKTGNNQPPSKPPNNKNDNDIGSPGAAAIALLKSIDESKEKAAEVLQKTCDYLTTSGGFARVVHAFRANCGHNFEPLFVRMGADINSTNEEGRKKVVEVGTKIIMDISQKLIEMGTKLTVDSDGLFRNIIVEYEGELITVRGCIHDGIIKIGTMFIQPQHVR